MIYYIIMESAVWLVDGALTYAHEGFAGHGVPGEGQLPAWAVRDAAGERVPAVMHVARLELQTNKQTNNNSK